MREPSFTIGVEEEYLIVDRRTRALVVEPPADMLYALEERIHDLVRPEFLKAQIEIGTTVCASAGEARAQLAELRSAVALVTADYGLAPIAASTHPFSEWAHQIHTDKERYNQLATAMQGVAQRLLICGMHVHIGIEDDNLRADLLNQASYFLPHLLALSTSSPFWRGRDTGLMSYRLSVFNEVPRTGLPGHFDTFAEYRRHVDILVKVGVIPDASMIWWDLRPSARFPTLEMRITDVCTRLDDAVAIAAMYQCVVRMLYRLRRSNQRWRNYANMLINENRWRAQRYGIDEGLIDFGKDALVPFADLVDELLSMIAEDADALNCRSELAHVRTILETGTSAHQQRAAHDAAKGLGASDEEALKAVVDWLIEETVAGVVPR
ncbi:MAG: carboxylate-amine ligase [Alphaproteobacteria bacterium]|nr:carboxylate-amine ligase [Alphaproteobacteria bacterium]MBF0250488.1 carboxylate-amine ligase [Alphaproteobacteria bacterium]